MYKKIIFLDYKNEKFTKEEPFIGGQPSLPNYMKWPKDPDNIEMTHLLSLPTSFINKELNTNYPSKHTISIFISYDDNYNSPCGEMELPSQYYLDEQLNNGYSKVLIYPQTCFPKKTSKIITKTISFGEVQEQLPDRCLVSTLGSSPCWVVNDINIPNSFFALQFYGNDITSALGKPNILNDDGMSYLFLNQFNPSKEKIGYFFTQTA